MSVEQIENFFFRQDFTLLVEYLKVVFFYVFVDTLKLKFVVGYHWVKWAYLFGTEHDMWLDDGKGVGDLNQLWFHYFY